MKTILVFIVLFGGCSGHISINSKKSEPTPEPVLPNYVMVEVGTINSNHNTKLYTIEIDGTKYYATYGTHYLPVIGPKVESKPVEKEF